jgi:hypothetical protein
MSALTEQYFTEAPGKIELLGYMAGGLRDCLDYIVDAALEIKAGQLWTEFGQAAGFSAERDEDEALELAVRIAACLDEIASCIHAHPSVRSMALTNAEAFRQGRALIEA